MALPASGPISSSMIAQEFSASQAPSGPNISLFGLASELGTPVTSNIFMGASFYGQSAFSGTSFSYNSSPEDNPTEACSLEEIGDTAYHNGSGTYPATGDNVYSDSAGTTPLENGSTYKYDNGGGNGGFLNIGASGVVSSLGNCRSDRRLKRNIIFRSYSKSGIPIYEFEYINKSDGEGRYVGTMAQDLIKLGKSEAVITDKKGYYLVNYNKIDVNFYEI
tara:strand:+ start:3811 stop:4470 length:660 start_codon:yes stop_codon:yes gene_type:complete